MKVVAWRCEDRSGCLDSTTARVRLGEGSVGTSGSFAVVVDGSQIGSAALLFQAEVEQAVIYRVVDIGSAGFAASRETVGGAAGQVGVLIDPISEATSRLLDEYGLENFADDGILEVSAAVRTANASTDFAGLTPDGAADLATQVARDDPQVQAVLHRRVTPTATPPGPSPTSTASASATPTATHTRSYTPSPTYTFSSTPTVTDS